MHNKTKSLAALLAGLVLGAAAQAQDFQAGLRMMTVPGEEPIPVALFFPTQAPEQTIPMGPFAPTISMRGTPAPAVKGLVLVSHGTGGSELGHHNLAQKLARHGYLVAALQHPRDNYRDRSLVATSTFFSERPKQVSRVLDALLENPEWKDRVPAGRIGAIGHSAGGYTVVALAGGVADPSRLAAHCKEPADDAKFCSLGGETAKQQVRESATPAADYRGGDPRIRAVVTMAPLAVVFTEESLAGIKVPMRVYTAEHDAVLKSQYHGERLRAVPGAHYERVDNAGHFAFMAQTSYPIAASSGDPGENPSGFDRKAFHQRLENEVTAFFDRHLK
ncbi:MAG TPA: hypothetical protein VEC35_13140 [Noviherbaspirillum sp.]|nr:hypothetical protein [Noviherbaspirillum sp.]